MSSGLGDPAGIDNDDPVGAGPWYAGVPDSVQPVPGLPVAADPGDGDGSAVRAGEVAGSDSDCEFLIGLVVGFEERDDAVGGW